ncbi:leucyl aminopeptidase [candidate division KSB1 bacterium]|nr:leucyl aminopeptidase [candidate division KSB1 bacterium]
MKISTVSGKVRAGYGAIAVCLFDDEVKAPRLSALDRETVREVERVIAAAKFTGKKSETVCHYAERGAAPLLIVQGLGSRKQFTWLGLRLAAGACVRAAQQQHAKSMALISEDKFSDELDAEPVMRSLVDGLVLGAWSFDFYKSNGEPREIAEVDVYFTSAGRAQAAARVQHVAEVMAQATNLAREWGTHPTNVVGINFLTQSAKTLSRKGLKVSTVEVPEMKRLGMNLFVAVGQASAQPPRLVIMDWNPRGAKKTYALIGKGMVFDSGGLNVKTAMMEEMKSDMCGAATVLATMHAVAMLKPKQRVIGLLACAENSVSGNAYRPSDIYTAMNGKTVEIGNTDAEGRLVLADSLCYAIKNYRLNGVIDIATLTGAAVVALGNYADAVFTNNERLQRAVLDAAERGGERMWPLPNYEEYLDPMKSTVADLNNAAGHRWGGACTAAAFLKQFVGDTPWVHIDIAPTSIGAPATSILPKAIAGGSGVRTLCEFLVNG